MNDDTDRDRHADLVNELLDERLGDDLDGVQRVRDAPPPDLMAEVDAALRLRRELRDVTPASPESRDRAIAAALAAFGTGATPVVEGDEAARAVIPLRRSWTSRILAGAAAVVAVLGIGIVATRGSDDDSTADESTSIEASRQTAAGPPLDNAPTGGAGRAGESSASTTVDPDQIITAMTAPASAGAAPAATEASPVVLGTRQALIDFARQQRLDTSADAGGSTTSAAASASGTCANDGDDTIARVLYEGRDALVVRRAQGTVEAVDPASCAVLESVAP